MASKPKISQCGFTPAGVRAPPNEDQYLTIKEIAALLSVSVRTVWRWVSAGEIKPIKFGRTMRFSKTEILFRSEKTEVSKPKTRDPLMG